MGWSNPAWYVVQRPFTKPTVAGPYPSSSFALEAVDRIHGTKLRRIKLHEGAEIWVGGIIVCSRRRARDCKYPYKDWTGEYANERTR